MSFLYTQSNYLNYHHLDVNSLTSLTGTNLLFSIYSIDQITGAFFVWSMNRKEMMLAICVDFLRNRMDAIITAVATTTKKLIGEHWNMSFTVIIANTEAPNYCVAIFSPHIRGRVAGSYNAF